MGSAESVGALHVDVDSPNYQSGDTIKGTIHLLMKQAVAASGILLFLKGTEKTEWAKHSGTGRRRRTITYRGKNRTLRQRFEVYKFPGGQAQVGQFSFPFAVESPRDMKSSFEYDPPYIPIIEAGRTLAVIGYKLVAKLDSSSPVDKGKAKLHITKPMTEEVSPYSDEMVAAISTWCCRPKGVVRMRASSDKTAYLPGETATATIEVNNEGSQLNVTGYSLSLHRTIRIRSNRGNTETYSSTLNSVSIDALVPAGTNPSDSAKQLQVVIPSDQNVENATTASGQLIECVYTLKAEVDMSGWLMCCGQTPRVEKVITIYPPQVEKAEAPKLEGEWKPTVMPKRQFSAGPGHEYEKKTGAVEVAFEE